MIAPLRDYMRIPPRKENIYLGDFFMMVVLFTALNAFLESFFFHRGDPVWLLSCSACLACGKCRCGRSRCAGDLDRLPDPAPLEGFPVCPLASRRTLVSEGSQ
ncbi:hypothetical protein NKK52_29415 [Mesorhizobium sp. C277A]